VRIPGVNRKAPPTRIARPSSSDRPGSRPSEFALHRHERPQPLPPSQGRARHPGHHDQREGRADADPLPDLQQDRQLHERDGDEK